MKTLVIVLFIIILILIGLLIFVKKPGADGNYSNKNIGKVSENILNDKNLTTLDLSNNQLKSLPAEIGKLAGLEILNVSNNQLTGALPAEIRKMTRLKTLNASHNQLTGIPAEIGQLKLLETVDFSYNNIDTMPNEIANIKDNLKVLDLTGNKYSAETISQIKNILPNTQVLF